MPEDQENNLNTISSNNEPLVPEPTPPVQDDGDVATPQQSDFESPTVVSETTAQQTETPMQSSSFDPTPAVEAELPTNNGFGTSIPSADQQNPMTIQPALQSTGSGKKKWFILGGAVAAVLLLVGGSGFAYALYQSPEKVLIDGVTNSFSTRSGSGKATLDFKSKEGTFNVALDVKGDNEIVNGTVTLKANVASENINLDASADFAATMSGDGYVKINNLQKIVDTVVDSLVDAEVKSYESYGTKLTQAQIAQIKKTMLDSYTPFVQKIDNKWIKFPASKSDDETSKIQKCYSDTFKKLQSDKDMKDELTKVYEKNKFVVIKKELGVKDGSYGFIIDLDTKKSRSFGQEAEKTKFVTAIKKCSNEESSSSTSPTDDTDTSSADDALKDTTIQLWVSQWSHQITGVNVDVNNKDDGTTAAFKLSINYDKPTGVVVPKDSTDFADIEKDLESQASSQTSGPSLLSSSIFDTFKESPTSLF